MIADRLTGPSRVFGRYALFDAIASGGMATVHLGRFHGAVGFARTVAIKRLHEQFARDREFLAMFVDEARLASRIHHPNVVQTLDIVDGERELFLVMEYVHGEPLAQLMRLAARSGEGVHPSLVVSILSGALMGLHAAHETKGERGESLGLIHRDVSPHNILVGVDGSARVLDFGVARAAGRIHNSQTGIVKGKVAYLPPELATAGTLDRTADVYAAAVVAWEALVGRRLFRADNPRAVVAKIVRGQVPAPSSVLAGIPASFDAVVLKGLARNPADRYQTAAQFAEALQSCITAATPAQVGAWVEQVARERLGERARLIAEIERRAESYELAELRAMVDDFATGSWVRASIVPAEAGASPASSRQRRADPKSAGTPLPAGAPDASALGQGADRSGAPPASRNDSAATAETDALAPPAGRRSKRAFAMSAAAVVLGATLGAWFGLSSRPPDAGASHVQERAVEAQSAPGARAPGAVASGAVAPAEPVASTQLPAVRSQASAPATNPSVSGERHPVADEVAPEKGNAKAAGSEDPGATPAPSAASPSPFDGLGGRL